MNEFNLTEYERGLFKKWVDHYEFKVMGVKTTVALLTIKNGFEVIGTSACVDPSNFDQEIGEVYAIKDALNKLDELQGFALQSQLDRGNK